MLFHCPVLVPTMPHHRHGDLSSPHTLHPGADIKLPSLSHADEDGPRKLASYLEFAV